MTRDYKFVALHQTTYDRLKMLGKKGESFDSIIKKLLPPSPAIEIESYPATRIIVYLYQCEACGNFMQSSQRPELYECSECGSIKWRKMWDVY